MLLTKRLCVSSFGSKCFTRRGLPLARQHRYLYTTDLHHVCNTSARASPTWKGNKSLRSQEKPPSRRGIISVSKSTLAESTRRKKDESLPVSCPGCGALSQEVDSSEPGYYSRSRKAVKLYFREKWSLECQDGEANGSLVLAKEAVSDDHTVEQTDTNSSEDVEKDVTLFPAPVDTIQYPICDRCHDLIYNSKGQSIAHPSVEDIADSIAESPFKQNHVYHVLDAADFPMSLFPKVFKSLELAKPRSQNRRARHKFTTRPSISFIITRSDLLAPNKEMVDKMLPYFQRVLRKALGRIGRDMRLGNVHLVSAKRGWWTTDIKENIWKRGGGNWMVGRVNVGKSNLFEVLFPKGSGDRAPIYAELEEAQSKEKEQLASSNSTPEVDSAVEELLAEDSLLPPPQPEVRFPTMPIVSSLPGTTASPIRLPFGGHRGELIDLPGLDRGSLEEFVLPEHKLDLVMQYRPNVKRHIIKPGQSLLLGGGLIRITPQLDKNDPSTTMLAYPFTPIEAHLTSTEKAIVAQEQQRESGIKSILSPGVGSQMSSAGTFKLDTDVTKFHAGALLRAGVSASKLAFAVYSTDILIEGVGWVELVCQIRKPRKSRSQTEHVDLTRTETAFSGNLSQHTPDSTFLPFASTAVSNDPKPSLSQSSLPQVEIFSPHGKHIGHRPPLGAWVVWDQGRKRRINASSSPKRKRKPMAGFKKQMKQVSRARGIGADVAS